MRRAILRFASQFSSREVLQQVRWEVRLVGAAAVAKLRPKQRAAMSRVRVNRGNDLRVNLGCGPLPTAGWLNVDGVSSKADLVQRFGYALNLPDGCAQVVFSEHVLEHLDYPDAARTFLREARRILRPTGVFRVVVPDAERAIRAYVENDTETLNSLAPGESTPIEVVNKIFRENGFHRFAWDYPLLEAELRAAGFTAVRRAEFRDSPIADLNIDLDEPARVAQSLYAEATAPA